MSIRDEEIPTLNIGDVIYECEYGTNIEVRLTSKPEEGTSSDGARKWSWTAVNTQNGEEVSYLLTEGFSHYGPRLYREPQYGMIKDGEWISPLLGAPQPTT